VETESNQRRITASQLNRWFDLEGLAGERVSYGRRLLQAGLTQKEVDHVARLYSKQLHEQTVDWHTKVLYGPAVLENK
jgi:hypothetical protein